MASVDGAVEDAGARGWAAAGHSTDDGDQLPERWSTLSVLEERSFWLGA